MKFKYIILLALLPFLASSCSDDEGVSGPIDSVITYYSVKMAPGWSEYFDVKISHGKYNQDFLQDFGSYNLWQDRLEFVEWKDKENYPRSSFYSINFKIEVLLKNGIDITTIDPHKKLDFSYEISAEGIDMKNNDYVGVYSDFKEVKKDITITGSDFRDFYMSLNKTLFEYRYSWAESGVKMCYKNDIK